MFMLLFAEAMFVFEARLLIYWPLIKPAGPYGKVAPDPLSGPPYGAPLGGYIHM